MNRLASSQSYQKFPFQPLPMSQVLTQPDTGDKTLLTYSALNTFRNCPRRYKNRYLDNLRPRERAESLSFGGVIHSAIELWYRSQVGGASWESRMIEVYAFINEAFKDRAKDPQQLAAWHLAAAMMRG